MICFRFCITLVMIVIKFVSRQQSISASASAFHTQQHCAFIRSRKPSFHVNSPWCQNYTTSFGSAIMAFIPPGITFLTRGLIALLLPCGAIATLKFILYNYYNIFIPTWALISGIAIGLPIVLTIRVQIVDMKHRRRAAVLGARVVPCVKGKWPGNIDEFRKFFTSIKEGYPGRSKY